jgi:hypothetical protein
MVGQRTTRGRWGVTALAGVIGLLAAAATATPASAKPSPYLAGDEASVHHFLREESARLGITPGFSVEMQEVPDQPELGRTRSLDANGEPVGRETTCSIEIGGLAHDGTGDLPETLAHEAFHCLEGQLAGTVANEQAHGRWLLEGAATWVESDLIANDRGVHKRWCDYLTSPTVPLFERTGTSGHCGSHNAYSGVGFFGHLAASGISPWHVFGPMLLATSDTAAYDDSGAVSPAFLDTEASAFFDDPKLGGAWTVGSQHSAIADGNVSHPRPRWPEVSVDDGDTKPVVVAPYADDPVVLVMKAPVLTVSWDAEPGSVPGQVRLRSTKGPSINDEELRTLVLCTTKRACASCPGARRFERGDLAIAGGPTGETVNLDGGCELPAESCAALLPESTFPSVGGEEALYTTYGQITADTNGPGSSSSECDVGPADMESTSFPATLGFVQLISFPSSKRAAAAYGNGAETPTLIADPSNPYALSPPVPVDIGDAADTYTFQNQDQSDFGVGGGLRVANDLFFFTCHAYDGGACPSASSVLAQVAAELG